MGKGPGYGRRGDPAGNIIKSETMPGGYLYGWDDAAGAWVKVACNVDGKMLVNAGAIFENPPTEDEANKGPSSEWAFDHKEDASAHHAKYTDAEARGAINNILNAAGQLTGDLNCVHNYIQNLRRFYLKWSTGDSQLIAIQTTEDEAVCDFYSYNVGTGFGTCDLRIYNGVGFDIVISQGNFLTELLNHLENPPTEDEDEKAPTSEWAFDHAADAAAHHARYTDAEAREACNLGGGLYHSIPGPSFLPLNPDTDQVVLHQNGYAEAEADDIYFSCEVILPDGCTVAGVIVYGNAGAAAETWYLRRIKLSDITRVDMAGANINTEDTTISYATIDNSTYFYLLITTSLDTGDRIYGARITFTI